MTYTERIKKLEREYEEMDTLSLVRIYNDNCTNVDGRTKGFAMFKASQYVLEGRKDAEYFSEYDTYKAYINDKFVD